ncbi:protein mono-ADP-ribosyltransferase PARP12-like isoform X2 [Athalia rosae]|uniref:protein mono-ADP-ribosyltransferase PARP12-like isoform X2 n=1 Tax=Athalia rosae TaxID=37344 RepID=UPI0020343187|nr:protein mono-ADP-ribosyltransferase PARP12-like isoform X2 [Athalia rosae]XP_048507792.1 protein mono-ADP-ribosyltransferase PARP12-like isoform X2 [Athalia rosae]
MNIYWIWNYFVKPLILTILDCGIIFRGALVSKESLWQIPDFQRAYIGRIENPYLWSRYVLRYEEMKAQNLTRHVTEQIVIHATSISAAYEIADNNFDWRLVKRHRYGKGVSFARDAGYANQHAKQNEAYIIAGILVAKTSVGHYSIQIPPNDIDTTTNPRHTVFVKYCDSDFYPYYIVY